MVRRQRAYKPVPRGERRNLKLWATGARETILEPHILGYADALERGWVAERDYVQDVCNEYHARISWRLTDAEDPPLPLPVYDKFAVPAREILTDDDEVEKNERVQTINLRIGRWLKYRARKLRRNYHMDPRRDPYAILMAKLADIRSPPKARQAFQQYMHESYETDILPTVEARWAAERNNIDGRGSSSTSKGANAPFRAQVARSLFAELPEEEQLALKERAKAEAVEARAAYDQAMKNGPSKDPAERQLCIDNLGAFMAPILRGICEYTGLHSVVIFGGPHPRYNGELRTLHVSHGFNHGPTPVHMPGWAKQRFDRDVIGLMKGYLETAFTAVERKEAALPSEEDTNMLDAAKYRFDDPHDDDDESGSDTDDAGTSSDSDTDSDSDASDSEDGSELSEKERKKRRRDRVRREKEKEKKRREKEKQKRKKEAQFKKDATALGSTKKRKRTTEEDGGQSKKAKTRREPATDAEGRLDEVQEDDTPSYDELRRRNIVRNKGLLADIDASLAEKGLFFTPGGLPCSEEEARKLQQEAEQKNADKDARKKARETAAAAAALLPAPPPRRSGRKQSGERMDEDDDAGGGTEDLSTPSRPPSPPLQSPSRPPSLPLQSPPRPPLPPLQSLPLSPPRQAPPLPPSQHLVPPTPLVAQAQSAAGAPSPAPVPPAPSQPAQASGAGNTDAARMDPPGAPSAPSASSPSSSSGAPPNNNVAPISQAAQRHLQNGLPSSQVMQLHRSLLVQRAGAFPLPNPIATASAPPNLGSALGEKRKKPTLSDLVEQAREKKEREKREKAANGSASSSGEQSSGERGSSSSGAAGSTSTPPTTLPSATPPPTLNPASWEKISGPAKIPKCPRKVPTWFEHAHEVISGAKLGDDFCDLVSLWIKLEAGYSYKTQTIGLTATGRPKEVSVWMGAGRGRRGGTGALGPVFPTVTTESSAVFGEKFNAWWASLQPKSRVRSLNGKFTQDAAVRDRTSSKDWEGLRAPGSNGIFIVILILFWWGRAIPSEDSAQLADWRNAVSDAAFMVQGLVELQLRDAQGKAAGDTDLESDQLRSDTDTEARARGKKGGRAKRA